MPAYDPDYSIPETVKDQQLAWDIVTMAAAGGMPDSFWETDRRIKRACSILRKPYEVVRQMAIANIHGYTLRGYDNYD